MNKLYFILPYRIFTHTPTHPITSNWPTFPQVYLNGELLGGADIMMQLHQNGEFVSELEKIGHRSALLDKVNDTQS
jgi:hypothetical protein